MKEQSNIEEDLAPELQRIISGEYRREREEAYRRMRARREAAERHLENAKLLRDSLKR